MTQENHHLGRPFACAYQIAIDFARRCPEDFDSIGMPIGGVGTGSHSSFSQYLGRELSRRIKSGELSDIEGGFLSAEDVENLAFHYRDQVLTSSLTGAWDVSLFRLKN